MEMNRKILLLLSGLVGAALGGRADQPPLAPQIIEPVAFAHVTAGDVHMVTLEMDDPDGDDHLCTTWQIVDEEGLRWEADCVEGLPRVHAHLGDGEFTDGPLRHDHPYILRVRFRSSSGEAESEWSSWSDVAFRTSPDVGAIRPMEATGVDLTLSHDWTAAGEPVVKGSLTIESSEGDRLLQITGGSWRAGLKLTHAHPIRLVVKSETEADLPSSSFSFHDESGVEREIFLPAIPAGEETTLWVSTNGSTHYSGEKAHGPVFDRVARMNPMPWVAHEPGFVIEEVVGGLQLPVDIAFRPNSGGEGPSFYVAELYGRIWAVDHEGNATLYAENLLNFDPRGDFPGSGEIGIGGIAVDPSSGDLYLTRLEPQAPGSGLFDPQIVRLRSFDGGWTAAEETVIRELTGEIQGPSHQISELSFGPDGALYVHMADGSCIPCARDLGSFRGKILRLGRDGEALPDSPFYDEGDGIGPADFVFSSGVRNPFGGAWRSRDGLLYIAENGPSTDRFARVLPGFDFGWAGRDQDMWTGAVYTWTDGPAAPVRVAVVEDATFAGSGFPRRLLDQVFVAESGATWATGPKYTGKQISRFLVTPAGELGADRATFVSYDGVGKGTVAALAAGPDGLYFSDLYADEALESPFAPGARVFRVRYSGAARIVAEELAVADGCAYRFGSARSGGIWEWQIEEQSFSGERLDYHFANPGRHQVRLMDGTGRLDPVTVVVSCPAAKGDGLLRTDLDEDGGIISRLVAQVPQVNREELSGVSTTVFEGRVLPRFDQIYELTVEARGDVRLEVDGRLVIDERSDGVTSGRLRLRAGHLTPLRLTVDRDAGSGVSLLWRSDSQIQSVIPASRLFAPIDGRRRGWRR